MLYLHEPLCPFHLSPWRTHYFTEHWHYTYITGRGIILCGLPLFLHLYDYLTGCGDIFGFQLSRLARLPSALTPQWNTPWWRNDLLPGFTLKGQQWGDTNDCLTNSISWLRGLSGCSDLALWPPNLTRSSLSPSGPLYQIWRIYLKVFLRYYVLEHGPDKHDVTVTLTFDLWSKSKSNLFILESQ